MTVKVTFHCGGCDAVAEGRTWLRREFVSFSGNLGGLGQVRTATVEDVTPEGWVAYDPYTYCTYCPACWKSIEDGVAEDAALRASEVHE